MLQTYMMKQGLMRVTLAVLHHYLVEQKRKPMYIRRNNEKQMFQERHSQQHSSLNHQLEHTTASSTRSFVSRGCQGSVDQLAK